MLRLLLNHIRRTWIIGLLAAIAAFAFQAVAMKVFQSIITGPQAAQAGLVGRLMPEWMQTAMGLQGPITSLPVFTTVIYQHPFLLAIVLAVPIAAAASFLAGEVEQRTMALLLARPLSRFHIVSSAAIVCLLWAAAASLAAWAGTWAGAQWAGVAVPELRMVGLIALNLFLVAAAAAGFALFVSSLLVEKSDAMGWCVTILLGMYVGHFLTQMYSQAGQLSRFLLFHYYTPGRLMGLTAPGSPAVDPAGVLASNALVLGCVALAGILTAAVIFSRRNLNL